MNLAKPYVDVGVRTNQYEAMFNFWNKEIGLPYEELLKIGGGVHQHRLSLNGSVFKLNHARAPLGDVAPTGFSEIIIAREDVTSSRSLMDPDGTMVTLVPVGTRDVTHLGIGMNVRSLHKSAEFLVQALGAEQLTPNRFRLATTIFELSEVADMPPTVGMQGRGFRYITVQVWRVDEEHQLLVARGVASAAEPMTLGSTARISFVTDPDGNWIEISQRASLTGDLSADR